MNCLILGGSGFIGSHLAKRLKEEGNWVRVVDIEDNQYMETSEFCDEFIKGDLRDPNFVSTVFYLYGGFDEIYQLAALMGGAQFIFTGDNDADIMYSSAMINLNIANECTKKQVKRLFYSSSACIYNQDLQLSPDNPGMTEDMAWPLNPDSDYGVEKGFSERLYQAFERNYGLTVRISRFHNIFGPQGTWSGGKEKAPAAICRKVAEVSNLVNFPTGIGYKVTYVHNPEIDGLQSIDIWGDGTQTRSFLYIDECVEGIIRLMRSDCTKVVNIGSEEMISINDLAKMVIRISGKNLSINNISGPTGVKGRNSHNQLIQQELGWKPSQPLEQGIRKLYDWVNQQVNNKTI